MPLPLTFKTKINGETPEGTMIRGILHDDLVAEADFVSTLFLTITGKKPNKAEKKILNAMMVAAIHHGVNAASGFVPRVVAASGNSMLTCMASTLMALGPYHGGAVSDAMEMFYELLKAEDKEKACEKLIEDYKAAGKRISGYGHAVYKNRETGDPRARQLIKMAEAEGLPREVFIIAEMLEETLEWKVKKVLVLNIDGAMAALLVSMNMNPKTGNALFALARVAGSIAHIIEEQESGNWVRRLADEAVEYER